MKNSYMDLLYRWILIAMVVGTQGCRDHDAATKGLPSTNRDPAVEAASSDESDFIVFFEWIDDRTFALADGFYFPMYDEKFCVVLRINDQELKGPRSYDWAMFEKSFNSGRLIGEGRGEIVYGLGNDAGRGTIFAGPIVLGWANNSAQSKNAIGPSSLIFLPEDRNIRVEHGIFTNWRDFRESLTQPRGKLRMGRGGPIFDE